MKPKITFLMMAYQAEPYISKAIESVLKQTEPNVVLLIRNNGSTDHTGEIIRKYAAEDERVHFVENSRNGITEHGIQMTDPRWWPLTPEITGEYVSFLDSDDWLMPDFTEKMYNAAIQNAAEMVLSGYSAFYEKTGKIAGHLCPPNLQSNKDKRIAPYFTKIYNLLRTWWGKLYKTDFFLKNYEKAWAPIYPATWSPLDTVVVLRYMKLCKRIASLDEPLYCFLCREGSSYNTEMLSNWRLIYARALYQEGIEVLKRLSADTDENKNYMLTIHWSYILEAIKNVAIGRSKPKILPMEELQYLANTVNDEVVGIYLNENFSKIICDFVPYIKHCMDEANDMSIIWDSFLVRIYTILSNYKFAQKNVLLFPMLLACVSDPHNLNRMGRNYFEKEKQCWATQGLTKGESEVLDALDNYLYQNPQDCVYWINNCDYSDEILSLENTLVEAYMNKNYEKACDLVGKIANKCPFSCIALYFRIKIAADFGEKDLALLLAATAKILWPYDKDIQELYWSFQQADYEFTLDTIEND